MYFLCHKRPDVPHKDKNINEKNYRLISQILELCKRNIKTFVLPSLRRTFHKQGPHNQAAENPEHSNSGKSEVVAYRDFF